MMSWHTTPGHLSEHPPHTKIRPIARQWLQVKTRFLPFFWINRIRFALQLTGSTQDRLPIPEITPADLQSQGEWGTPVRSNAQKFVIPVPAWGQRGEPLVYPAHHPRAGQPILDYTGAAIGEYGLIFFNGKDHCSQAVAGDGRSVIIINEVTQGQAAAIERTIRRFRANPNDLTLNEFKQVLLFIQEHLGLLDVYHSTRAFVEENMSPAIARCGPTVNGVEIPAYGFKRRNGRDKSQAIFIPGTFVFAGPAISPQCFRHGGVIVNQDGSLRGIQPDVFVRTYQLADGRPIRSVARDLIHHSR